MRPVGRSASGAELSLDLLEVLGDRRFDGDARPGQRVGKGESPGVQHLPRHLEPAAAAVDAVAQHRMAEVLEVQANLVLAAGLERQLEQGAGACRTARGPRSA